MRFPRLLQLSRNKTHKSYYKVLEDSDRDAYEEMYLHIENRFGFTPKRSTMEAIHLMRKMMENYRDRKRYLHIIDLKKAYDKVPIETNSLSLVLCFSSKSLTSLIPNN